MREDSPLIVATRRPDIVSANEGPRLAELVAALSTATDFGMNQASGHGLRACLLAVRLGASLGLSQPELRDTYYVALLRFAGCTANMHVEAAVFGDELAAREWLVAVDSQPAAYAAGIVRHLRRDRPFVPRAGAVLRALVGVSMNMDTPVAHCEAAQHMADRLGLGREISRALGQAYERWGGGGIPNRSGGDAIAVSMRIAKLAHHVIILSRLGKQATVAALRKRAGTIYDPAIVACFCEHASDLLQVAEIESPWQAVLDAEPGRDRARLSEVQLAEALRAIGDFADLQSPFFAAHSSGVAELAASAAQRCGLPDQEVDGLRCAGYLHDIGRVSISAGVWGRPGPLTDADWERVRLHPYFTERIFARSVNLSRIASLAAFHHERVDGSGYHRGIGGEALSLPALILAAADCYRTKLEPRPHRPALSPDSAAAALGHEVREGRLDRQAVTAVLEAAGRELRIARQRWPADLSDREVEVLRALARGYTKRQIADLLGISRHTADHHVRHIYDKVGVSTRAAVTLFAMKHRLLGPDVGAGK